MLPNNVFNLSATYDLDLWPKISENICQSRCTHAVICMPSFIMIGWEMAEILHFEILRKLRTNKQTNTHTHTHTHKHTHKQTHRHGHYNTSPSPMGGEVINDDCSVENGFSIIQVQNVVLLCEFVFKPEFLFYGHTGVRIIHFVI